MRSKVLCRAAFSLSRGGNTLKSKLVGFLRGFDINKSAFTLAEVLITIGIIGVVAAMTLPTLINKYKEQVTVSKVKKHTQH